MHNIQVMSRATAIKEINSYKASVAAVISIVGTGEETPDFQNDTNMYLQLNFNNVSNEQNGGMTKEDAKKIVDFINEADKTCCKFIIVDESGFGRSSGIAAALEKFFDNDDRMIEDKPTYKPNMYCYRTTYTAFKNQ